MKKLFKKIYLILCLMVTIFSVMSVSTKAEEIRQNKEVVHQLRTDVLPRKIYISDKIFYNTGGLPKKYRYYTLIKDGVYYSGKLTLTQYQSTGDGYLGLYSGYIYR